MSRANLDHGVRLAAGAHDSQLRSANKRRNIGGCDPWNVMSSDPPPITDEILGQEKSRLFGHIVGARVAILPLFIALLLSAATIQHFFWQRAILVSLAIVVPSFFVFELWRYKKRGLSSYSFVHNLSVGVVGHLLVCAATGGLLSPFIYVTIPLAINIGVLMTAPVAALLLGLQISAVWSFAVLGAGAWFPEFSATALAGTSDPSLSATYFYSHALFVSFVIVVSSQIGRRVTRIFLTTLTRTLNARHELLASHQERVKELTSLSAEIAHELKNPLASVKGLSGLLTQNITDEKGAERLHVLRREVDRMQSVLEEFLNFSRPLVPLAIVSSDAQLIASEVVALHEGLAQQHSVRLVATGDAATVACDRRKVKQILINLVQNALHASPEGSTITVHSQANGENVTVRIKDEGPGIDPELGSVFDPGVTSKVGGAGLGLTIARALARQHGGELTLTTAAEGGALAELSLPRTPPTDVAPTSASARAVA